MRKTAGFRNVVFVMIMLGIFNALAFSDTIVLSSATKGSNVANLIGDGSWNGTAEVVKNWGPLKNISNTINISVKGGGGTFRLEIDLSNGRTLASPIYTMNFFDWQQITAIGAGKWIDKAANANSVSLSEIASSAVDLGNGLTDHSTINVTSVRAVVTVNYFIDNFHIGNTTYDLEKDPPSSPPTDTPTAVPPTNTNVPPTNTPTNTNTNVPVPPTNTNVPPTNTPTNTNTNVPVPPTAVPPTNVPPSNTPTKTNTPVPTQTFTNTPVPPTQVPTINNPEPPIITLQPDGELIYGIEDNVSIRINIDDPNGGFVTTHLSGDFHSNVLNANNDVQRQVPYSFDVVWPAIKEGSHTFTVTAFDDNEFSEPQSRTITVIEPTATPTSPPSTAVPPTAVPPTAIPSTPTDTNTPTNTPTHTATETQTPTVTSTPLWDDNKPRVEFTASASGTTVSGESRHQSMQTIQLSITNPTLLLDITATDWEGDEIDLVKVNFGDSDQIFGFSGTIFGTNNSVKNVIQNHKYNEVGEYTVVINIVQDSVTTQTTSLNVVVSTPPPTATATPFNIIPMVFLNPVRIIDDLTNPALSPDIMEINIMQGEAVALVAYATDVDGFISKSIFLSSNIRDLIDGEFIANKLNMLSASIINNTTMTETKVMTFKQPGDYVIVYAVKDDRDAIASVTMPIIVSAPPTPTATATAMPDPQNDAPIITIVGDMEFFVLQNDTKNLTISTSDIDGPSSALRIRMFPDVELLSKNTSGRFSIHEYSFPTDILGEFQFVFSAYDGNKTSEVVIQYNVVDILPTPTSTTTSIPPTATPIVTPTSTPRTINPDPKLSVESNNLAVIFSSKRELTIRWIPEVTSIAGIKRYDLYINGPAGTGDFLGSKPAEAVENDGSLIFYWPEDVNSNSIFYNGPEYGEHHKLWLYALTKSGNPRLFGPYETETVAFLQKPDYTSGASPLVILDSRENLEFIDGTDQDVSSEQSIFLAVDSEHLGLNLNDVKEYHFHLIVDATSIYLGRSEDSQHNVLNWTADNLLIHPDYRDGPQFGKNYQFRVYAIMRKSRPIKLADSVIISYEKFIPLPTPTSLPALQVNEVLAVVDGTNSQAITITWRVSVGLGAVDYHVWSQTPEKDFIGRTGDGNSNLFVWHEAKAGVAYTFGVFALFDDDRRPELISISNPIILIGDSGLVSSTPTATVTNMPVVMPTDTVTPIPTEVPAPVDTPTTVIPTPTATITPTVTPKATVTQISTAIPTASPTSLPWNFPQRTFMNLDSEDQAVYFRIAPDNQARHGAIAWDATTGMIIAGTTQPTGEWLKVRQDTFYDPRVRPYVAMGIVTDFNQTFMFVPVGVMRIDGVLVYVTPTTVQPQQIKVSGGIAHFFAFDTAMIIDKMADEGIILDAQRFAGIEWIDYYIRAELPGDTPRMWWDFIALLTSAEFQSKAWRGLTENDIWDTPEIITPMQVEEEFQYYLPPLENDDAIIIININNFPTKN